MAPTRSPNPDARVWVVNTNQAGLLGWLFRYYTLVLIAVLLAGGVAAIGVYRTFAAELPDLDDIESYRTLAPGVTRIYAGDGTLLAELAREHRAYAAYAEIPRPLVQAFLAAEDRRFFSHGGLDVRGLARAVVANVRSGTVVQGGSTITQQVAKGFLSDDRTLARKLREAILSIRLEARLQKQQILEIYLNKIFLGHGAYGVAAAASRYFGKELDELTLAECALIAGLARAPSRYSPVSSRERAHKRRNGVLQDMVEAGFITPQQRGVAAAEPIRLATVPDVFRQRAPYYAEHVRRLVSQRFGDEAVLHRGLQIETALDPLLQSFAQQAVDEAVRDLDERQGWRGPVAHLPDERQRQRFLARAQKFYGPRPFADVNRWVLGLVEAVETKIAHIRVGDARAELALRQMRWASRFDHNTGLNDVEITDVRDALEVGDVVWVRYDEKASERAANENIAGSEAATPPAAVAALRLGQTPRIEAALFTMEQDTGYVVALQGGHDYDRSQFNRATQACRQPGSVFKAIYYAYALDTGEWDMGSVLDDVPYQPEPDEAWDPQNLHGTIEGKVLLRNAFIFSLNLPSIRLFQRLGAAEVVAFARKLGFTTELIADKALSLGASCVRIDELTRAFAILAGGGTERSEIYVRRIIDKDGKVVVDDRHPYDGAMDVRGRLDKMAHFALAPPKQIVDRRTAWLVTKMMRDVVTTGIGRNAQKIGVEAGGKSGTASKKANTTDTWFVGFTSNYVTAAWVGDDTYERSLGDEDASYTTATPMWTKYMTRVVEGIPHDKVPFERPRGIVAKTVDAKSGQDPTPGLPTATLYFKE